MPDSNDDKFSVVSISAEDLVNPESFFNKLFGSPRRVPAPVLAQEAEELTREQITKNMYDIAMFNEGYADGFRAAIDAVNTRLEQLFAEFVDASESYGAKEFAGIARAFAFIQEDFLQMFKTQVVLSEDDDMQLAQEAADIAITEGLLAPANGTMRKAFDTESQEEVLQYFEDGNWITIKDARDTDEPR